MKPSHVVGIALLALVALLGLAWVVQGNEFFLYKTFAPKYEQVRRETFEHTRSFTQGMVQDLQKMQFEYVNADDDHKDALASIIVHRAAGFDLNDPVVPADLRQFVERLRRERTQAR